MPLKRYIVFSAVFAGAIAACSREPEMPPSELVIPVENGVIFGAENENALRALPHLLGRAQRLWTPTEEDVAKAELTLATYLEESDIEMDREIYRDLPNYKRQYIGFYFYDEKQPWIVINALYDWDANIDKRIATHIFDVIDGGRDYFKAYYDLSAGQVRSVVPSNESP